MFVPLRFQRGGRSRTSNSEEPSQLEMVFGAPDSDSSSESGTWVGS